MHNERSLLLSRVACATLSANRCEHNRGHGLRTGATHDRLLKTTTVTLAFSNTNIAGLRSLGTPRISDIPTRGMSIHSDLNVSVLDTIETVETGVVGTGVTVRSRSR